MKCFKHISAAKNDEIPAPLVHADCDLRSFPFMPLDVVRLRDSDIAAISNGEEFRAAVLLWCASWHQVPAGSLPDDDLVLSQLSGYGRVVKEWKKVREGAMRGWVKCNDGRLYHPVIAEKAAEAWKSKLQHEWRIECARIKKSNQRHGTETPFQSYEQFVLSRGTSQSCPEGQPNLSRGTNQARPEGQPHTVPDVSHGKQHPTDTERDTDTDTDTNTVVTREGIQNSSGGCPAEPDSSLSTTTPGLACKAMREEGISETNPSHPVLIALVAAGASADEFRLAAKEGVSKGKYSFHWVIATVRGRREDAAKLVLHKGTMPNKQEALEKSNSAATAGWKPPELREVTHEN